MNEPLLRYSSSKRLTLRSETQRPGEIKPNGLWISVGTAWKEWCEDENFRLAGLRHCFKVILTGNAHILVLDSIDAIDEFDHRYRCSPPWANYIQLPGGMCHWIDWMCVAKDYQGIIINPYCWARRFVYIWYSGWDCASGCIWDARAIASVELLEGAADLEALDLDVKDPVRGIRSVELD